MKATSTLSAEAHPATLPQTSVGEPPPPEPPPAEEADRSPSLGADEKVEAKKVEPVPIVAVKRAEQTLIMGAKLEAPTGEAKKVEPAPIVTVKRTEQTLIMGAKREAPSAAAKEVEPAPLPEREAPSAAAKEVEPAPLAEAKRGAPSVETKTEAASGAAEDERFFSEGDLVRHVIVEPASDDALTVPDTRKRKSEPAVVERRARFARYVRWAVAGAAVVCLAAVGRTLLSSSASSAPAPLARPEPTSVVASAPPAVTKAAESAAAPVVAEPLAESASAAKPEPPTGDAREEKAKARTLLERRKLAESIEAGERSVALDPSDGEAWLILGAALQEKGDNVAARRAYASCVKEARSGPRHECAKLLR